MFFFFWGGGVRQVVVEGFRITVKACCIGPGSLCFSVLLRVLALLPVHVGYLQGC